DARVTEAPGEAVDDAGHDVLHGDWSAQETGDRRDPLVADAAGDDVAEHAEIRIDVEREAVPRTAAGDADADGRHLLLAHPHAGQALAPAGFDAEVGEDVDEHALDLTDIPDDVAQTRAPLRQRDDGVADELAGPVVRDIAPAIGPHQLRTDLAR